MTENFKLQTSNFKILGFTLIEVAVAIGIAAVFTTLLIVYTGSSKAQIIFFKEQAVLVKSVLRAKSLAIEAYQPKQDPGGPPSSEIICGWGIYADTNPNTNQRYEYKIFRDLTLTDCAPGNTDLAYTPGGVGGTNESFEVFELDPQVKISCLAYLQTAGDPCEDGTAQDPLNIVFIPPEPAVAFTPAVPGDVEAVIRIELADGSRGSDIRVGLGGQVSF